MTSIWPSLIAISSCAWSAACAVCIAVRILDQKIVECLILADVATDHHGIARSGMGECQRLSAQSRKDGQPRRTQFLNGIFPLPSHSWRK